MDEESEEDGIGVEGWRCRRGECPFEEGNDRGSGIDET